MRALFIIILVLAFFRSQAQITITLDDLAEVGDTVNLAVVGTAPPNFKPGTAGPNQTWDFTNLVMDTNQYLYFVDPAATPFAGSFPASNMVMIGIMDSVYLYTIRNSFHFKMDGFAGVFAGFDDLVVPFMPPEILMNFPMNYLDSLEQTVIQDVKIKSDEPFVDSLRYKLVNDIITVVDAWGNLTTPISSYEVLRIKQTRIVTDSIWMKVGFFWVFLETSTNASLNYRYVANDAGYAVLEFQSDTAGTEYSGIRYLLDETVSLPDPISLPVVSVFPNPANSEITFSWNDFRSGNISIYDPTGRMLIMETFSHSRQLKPDIGKLNGGLYFYQLQFFHSPEKQAGRFLISR
jgi:hypothetical protein